MEFSKIYSRRTMYINYVYIYIILHYIYISGKWGCVVLLIPYFLVGQAFVSHGKTPAMLTPSGKQAETEHPKAFRWWNMACWKIHQL